MDDANNPVIDLLKSRYTGRAIASDPLSGAVVEELIEAARLAPSCFNKQPWRFLFLETPEACEKGAAALAEANRPWAGRASLLVVGYSREEDDCVLPDGRTYHQFDLGLSVMNLILAATHRRLAARPMAGFDPARVREAFGLDEADQPMIVIAVGKPTADESHLPEMYRGKAAEPRERKSAKEIARRV